MCCLFPEPWGIASYRSGLLIIPPEYAGGNEGTLRGITKDRLLGGLKERCKGKLGGFFSPEDAGQIIIKGICGAFSARCSQYR